MSKTYKIKNVSKAIKESYILKDINLEFKVGLNIIVGQSGAGKSTLLNLIGLIDECSEGEINFGEIELNKVGEEERDKFRAENIGFIFQNSNLIPDMTVRENLQMAMEISSRHTDNYTEILERFNVGELLDKKVCVLSGGEQQRIALVRALLKQTKIILADEPTGNLDSQNTENVFQILNECAKKYNRIVIVVTHDEKMARKYANTLIEISDGKVRKYEELSFVDTSCDSKIKHSENVLKSKLRLKRKLRFVTNFFKRKTGKVATTIFMAAVTIALAALVFDLNNQTTKMFDDMNTGYLETDLIQIYTKTANLTNNSKYGATFSVEGLKEIQESSLFNEVTEFIEMDLLVKNVQAEIDIPNVRYIELNGFYEKRIMMNDVSGQFPSSDKEIILGADICQFLFGEASPIGQVVDISNGSTEIQVTIVGVNNTKNAEGIYLSYMVNEITFELAAMDVSPYAVVDIKSDINQNSNIHTGGYTGGYNIKDNYPLIEGRYPESDDEIAIDIEIYNQYKKKHVEDSIYQEELYFNIGNVFEVKVCGVYDSDREQMYCVKQGLIDRMKNPAPTSIYCYAKNDNVIGDFENTDISRNYNCALMYDHLRGQISERTDSVTQILFILAILLCAISFVVINSFVNMSIKERTYEIGVLRALGGTQKDIRGIFWLESFILGLVSSVIAIVIFVVGRILITNTLLDNSTTHGMTIIFLLIAVFCVLLVMLSSVVPLMKINKMKPIECIRQR